MPNLDAVEPLRPLTRFSMLLRSLEAAGDSRLEGRAGLEGGFDGAGEVAARGELGAGDDDDFFDGSTVWNADPADGDGEDGDAHGDLTGDAGDVRGGGAAADSDADPGDPAGMEYGENRFCRNRSLGDRRCCAPEAAAAAMRLGLLRWCAYAEAKSGLCWAARASWAFSSIGLKPEARCW
jgi:hypothetical protein